MGLMRFLSGLTLIFLVVFALDLYPGLRGGAGWAWTYELPHQWLSVALLALILLIYVVVGLRLQHTVLWAFVGSIVITLAVVGIRGDVGFLLFTRTVSPVQTGASALAVRILAQDGTHAALERWTQIMDEAHDMNLIHFTTSPPGQPLIHDALAKAFDSPVMQPVSLPISMALRPYQCSDTQVMAYTRGEIVSAGFGLLMPILAALAVFPLYMAAVDLTGDSKTARKTVLWWALIPTITLFAPTWNTVYPALCITSFALVVRGLVRQKLFYALLAGLVMSLTSFLNFAVLPVLLLFGLFALGYGFKQRGRFIWLIIFGGLFALGLLSLWLMFWLYAGVSPLAILQMTFSSHRDLVQREYLPWLILNPYDVALFLGLPVAGTAVLGMVRAVYYRKFTPIDILALSFGAMVLVVDLLGLVQGENGRILSFYAPFALLAGVYWIRSVQPLLILQTITLLVMASVLATVPLDLNPQPTAPRTDINGLGDGLAFIPADATFTSADYSGEFQLTEYRYIGDPASQAITFEFVWRGFSPTERPYQFELLATAYNDIDGDITAPTFRWYPQNGNYLTSCWSADDVIRDVVVLPLPPVSKPVIWNVQLKAVDDRSGDSMLTTLDLEPVRYP